MNSETHDSPPISQPLSLIAELTHRCPLHCLYCSNPIEMKKASEELTTDEWSRVFREAAELGVLHLHLTGGEPLVRKDLVTLVASAHDAGLYVNMVTSGIGLTESRLAELTEAGLEHLQLSFQDLDQSSADYIAGTKAHAFKLAAASIIRRFPIAFTINLVVHRMNLDRLDQFISIAAELGPDRLEIAHVQYYGWALTNRALLMPTEDQVRRSLPVIAAAREKLSGRIAVDAVLPDYFASFPKPCVGGWGREMILIDPMGQALPCHAAAVIPSLVFDNVRHHPLRWLWQESTAFERFRGDSWMPATCKACPRKDHDFAGCRCQAFLLTGDPETMDPVCAYSPYHGLLQSIRTPQSQPIPIWRKHASTTG